MSILPKSILFKLVSSIILMFTVGFIFFTWYVIPILKSEINTLTHKQQNATAQYIVNVIDKKIIQDTEHISYLANSLNNKKMTNKNRLYDLINMQIDFANSFKYGMVILNKDGLVLAQSRLLTQRTHANFSNTKWFKELKKEKKALISYPFAGKENKEPMINIVAPILDKEKNFIGAIYVSSLLDSSGFLSFLYKENINNIGDFIIICPTNKIIVATNNEDRILKPVFKKGENEMHDKVMKGYRGSGLTTNPMGIEIIVTIKDIQSTGWFIVISTPTSEAYHIIGSFLNNIKVLGFTFILIFSISLAFIIFIILKPLKDLSNSVRLLDPNKKALAQIPYKREDEIGDLIIGFNSLITTINKYTTKLAQLALKDGLTGIFNRRYFDENINKIWAEKAREKKPLSLVMVDIDFFKKYNDAYGHQKGDVCLQEIVKVLASQLKRASDILCRYGGEEFVIIIKGEEEQAIEISRKIKTALIKLKKEHKATSLGFVTVSMGIASITPHTKQDVNTLIKEADEALYTSKRNGRNCFTVFDNE